ncbi:Ornithine decarboxylase [Teratosphaeria destructans]|uniref:Ornithine decarboxylase n=1 Tax=Teratosphaeria destructans TaxID=418781 RepID=A0A9W7T1F9_9PEZI|nr:Ornithine decarboxylase [Teratosphaeria destructans]
MAAWMTKFSEEPYATVNYPVKPLSYLESGEENVHHGAKIAKEMIGAALQKHIQGIDPHDCEAGEEDAFFVADVGDVYRQHMRWKKRLARVTPHYAVKCNPDPTVLRLLAAMGAGFDCASKSEIEQVLKMGVDPSRIIYAQPCKTKSYLRYTAKQSVKQMTFDNTDELYKIKELSPDAELYLRILTDDSASLCRLSQKFGASMEATKELLNVAKKLDLNIAGVAFHVGSGASDPSAFRKAVSDARLVFDQAEALGFEPHTLDCGGGFVSETFDEMAAVLSESLDTHFAPHYRIIAEPGRYYTSSAFTLACNVIARRTVEDKEMGTKSYMLYMNDGVYGNFSSIMFDHQHPIPQVLSTHRKPDGFNYSTESLTDSGYTSAEEGVSETGGKMIEYSIWGPTCDGIDCIAERWSTTETVDVGDWLYFDDMGAYTKCSATRFNGFTDKHETVYVSSEPGASALLGF